MEDKLRADKTSNNAYSMTEKLAWLKKLSNKKIRGKINPLLSTDNPR
jgi:hypothetical protein